jgi:dynein heavy chain
MYCRSVAVLNYSLQMMLETAKKPNVKDCCGADGRLKELRGLSCCLQKCQKSLNDYLNSKRNAFPRFIFISDEELLPILGTSHPSSVQEHMVKVCVML